MFEHLLCGPAALDEAVPGDRVADLADVAASLAQEFVHGGLTQCSTVECNPVILTDRGALIADVLLVNDEESHE